MELPSQVNFYSNIGMLSIDYDLNGYLDIIFTRNSFENIEMKLNQISLY